MNEGSDTRTPAATPPQPPEKNEVVQVSSHRRLPRHQVSAFGTLDAWSLDATVQ